MKKLNICLKNCYGISNLSHTFDFNNNCNTYLIYAANGIMKTSFAKTFRDISENRKPCDQINSTKETICKIENEIGIQIKPDEIYVIDPYNPVAFDSEESVLLLLSDEEARKNYMAIYKDLDSTKKKLIKNLKQITASSNCEAEIIEAFSCLSKPNIFEIFDAIEDQITHSKFQVSFRYNEIFDKSGKVKIFLDKNIHLLTEYCQRYEELITNSRFFSKNGEVIFGTSESNNLKESLIGDAYFSAGHKLSLNSSIQINSSEQLSKIIEDELNKIFSDTSMRDVFDKIDKQLSANKDLIAFKKVLEKDNTILLKLRYYESFRREVWFSYLKQIEFDIKSLIGAYNDKKPTLEKIINDSNSCKSAWDETIEEFKNRFSTCPFSVMITNKSDAILNSQTPTLQFIYDGKNFDRNMLIDKVLSQGEKRIIYLLHVIFNLKSRIKLRKNTMLIIDDIADSFDYKNKYSIVEYLKDLSNIPDFKIIILTHNFDFFRTLQSRMLGVNSWNFSLIAERSYSEIKLSSAGNKNITNPFALWRTKVNVEEKALIACIPLVRNLIEFKDGNVTDQFRLLTHVLHKKECYSTIKSTTEITIADIEPVFQEVLRNVNFKFQDKSKKIIDIIYEQCEVISNNSSYSNLALEDKIILAIGIRLKAEQYMWNKVKNLSEMEKMQTGELFDMYKSENPVRNGDEMRVLESVVIITPEQIHLNSFMYEPILDMGIDELINLYNKVRSL